MYSSIPYDEDALVQLACSISERMLPTKLCGGSNGMCIARHAPQSVHPIQRFS